MEQHPIPQQISSYQFRLIGDMTLKQFAYIAGGVLIALLIYATGLHPILKWPLILIFVGGGAAFAFLPFEERPLSTWFVSFFRSVYSPTSFIWKKTDKPVLYYKEEELEVKTADNLSQADAKYLSTPAEQGTAYSTKLDAMETNLLQKITGLFSNVFVPKPKYQEPSPFVSEEKLPEETKKEGEQQTPPEIEIPSSMPVGITPQGSRPKIVVEETPTEEVEVTTEPQTTEVSPVLTDTGSQATTYAQFSIDAAPPHPPTIPNTITGQVMNPEGKIIEGAILEIKDLAGRPVRALRSNKVGHFMIVTSLVNGQYELIIDKAGYYFEPVTFKADGNIIPPIAIRAKAIVDVGSQNDLPKNNPQQQVNTI